MSDIKTAEYYTQEAERLIRQSGSIVDSAIRQEMLRVAAGFHQLAASMQETGAGEREDKS